MCEFVDMGESMGAGRNNGVSIEPKDGYLVGFGGPRADAIVW